MTKCLYVGNLPHECTEQELETIFETGGHPLETVTIVLDKRTGRSRGFAFVHMPNEEEAAGALESLRGTELAGRALKFGNAYREQREDNSQKGGYEYESRPRRGGGRRR